MKKRYKSVVVAIAKDEETYVLEWAAYHLAIGFEHIWIYDNASRVSLREHLSATAAHEHISVVDWPNVPGENAQFAAYAHFLKTNRSRVDWIAVVDLDEFLCLKKHDSIDDFLSAFDDANGIAINWRYFGSAGHIERSPGLLMDRFTRAAEIDHSIHEGIKTISRATRVGILTPHYAEHLDGNRIYSSSGRRVACDWRIPIDAADFEIAQVNHYFVKSREEWETKIRRGYGWPDEDRRNLHTRCDQNQVEDRAILRWRAEVERWTGILTAPRQSALRRLFKWVLGLSRHHRLRG